MRLHREENSPLQPFLALDGKGDVNVNRKKEKLRRFMDKEEVSGLVFASPFIIGFLAFMVIPMLISLYYSFCKYDILTPPVFVGLKNYIKILTEDAKFYKSMGVTAYYTLVGVPLRLVFALFVAMLLYKSSRLNGLYRGLYYLPSIIGGSVAVSILWKRMFAVDGVINKVLAIFGVPEDFAWLGNEKAAIWVLVILAVWQFGSSMLIFLSSLKQISVTLYEAARVDGAGKIASFFKITLPLLTPTIFFNLVMQTIFSFLAFTQCYIITQGKPMDSTLFYAVYMYQQSFEYYQAGYGAALAWLMLMVIGAVTLLLFATKRFWVYDEGASS